MERISISASENGVHFDRSDARESSQPIRVWVVEDKAYVREPLMQMLDQEEDLDCERGFDSAEGMLEALRVSRAPNVVLSDFNLGAMTGAESISRVVAQAPETRVVIMTSFSDSIKEMEAKGAGAAGFLLKSQAAGDFAKEMRKAVALEVNPALAATARIGVCGPSLPTSRERTNRASARETQTETRVSGDAIVVWVKRVFKTFGGSSRASTRRARLSFVHLPD